MRWTVNIWLFLLSYASEGTSCSVRQTIASCNYSPNIRHLDAPMVLAVKSLVNVDKHMTWWIWSLSGNLTNYYQSAHQMVRYISIWNPPFWMPGSAYYEKKTCKKKMRNHCVYIITWYISVAVCKTDANSYNTAVLWSSPKWLASRIGPFNSRCSEAAPGKLIDLKFSGNMPSLILGKVRKFQHRSSSRFGDIPEKTWGVDENNPLPLIGLIYNPPS